MSGVGAMSKVPVPTRVGTAVFEASRDRGWFSVTYGAGLFVAVANTGTGNRVMTSPDGITWTSRTSAADNNWSSVVWTGRFFYAVAPDSTAPMVSFDGVTWQLAGDPFISGQSPYSACVGARGEVLCLPTGVDKDFVVYKGF